MRRSTFVIVVSVWVVCLLPAMLRQSAAQRHHRTPVVPVPVVPALGAALPGLTREQATAFADGLKEFTEVEAVQEGLGPVFNGKSCAECHAHPVVGGSSPDRETTVVVRIGGRRDQGFYPMTEFGGSVLQRRSIREIDPTCPVEGERVPPEATIVSHRLTPPLFGAGLIEAIPDATILALSDPQDRNADGISGVANRVFNPESGRDEIGRFGWKAHVPTLHLFAGDAYLNEMGITNPTFPQENQPQGQPIPAGWDAILESPGHLEDDGKGVDEFAHFMRLLAPAAPVVRSSFVAAAVRGATLFQQIGCASCHVPALMTGDQTIAALRRQPARLYSDLLLHDMGPGLADGIEMGLAMGSEWRTTPLWGLSRRKFFLHDGRALSIQEAVLSHGGEASAARDRFLRIDPGQRAALLMFLGSL